MENPRRYIWKCGECDDYVVSYANIRHDMNWCECGKSAMDIEEVYMRSMGNPIVVSVKELVDDEWKPLKEEE